MRLDEATHHRATHNLDRGNAGWTYEGHGGRTGGGEPASVSGDPVTPLRERGGTLHAVAARFDRVIGPSEVHATNAFVPRETIPMRWRYADSRPAPLGRGGVYAER